MMQNTHSSKLALFTFILAFVVILLGAYTRLTDAGLSCPDWPHCYGYITAPHTPSQLQAAAEKYPLVPVDVKKAWTEMTHRYFAGTEGILILILSLSMLKNRVSTAVPPRGGSFAMKSSVIAFSLIGLLCVQVMLGMLTVTEKLKPVIVLSHLLTGISILSVLWWAYLNSYFYQRSIEKNTPPRLVPWIVGAFFIVAMQITLGGWVSTHYAGLACVDFPYCNGSLLPPMQWDNLNGDLITIHMLHRIGALITATYLCVFAFCLLRFSSFRSSGLFLLVLIALQIKLGILNIIWLRPVWIALIHQAVAIILLLTIIAILVKAFFTRENRYDSQPA